MRLNLPLYIRKDTHGIIDIPFELSELYIERTNKVYPIEQTWANR